MEKINNVQEAIVEAKNIMKKDFREFTFLLLYLFKEHRICLERMPIEDMNRFISGLKWFNQEVIVV